MKKACENFPFSKINYERCISNEGFNFNPEKLNEFNSFMLIALTEELGEMAGAMKKLLRPFNKRDFNKTLNKMIVKESLPGKVNEKGELVDNTRLLELESYDWNNLELRAEVEAFYYKKQLKAFIEESADFLIYYDMMLTHNGIDIHEAVKEKFNKVSKEMGCPQFSIL